MAPMVRISEHRMQQGSESAKARQPGRTFKMRLSSALATALLLGVASAQDECSVCEAQIADLQNTWCVRKRRGLRTIFAQPFSHIAFVCQLSKQSYFTPQRHLGQMLQQWMKFYLRLRQTVWQSTLGSREKFPCAIK